MLDIGKCLELEIVRFASPGAYLINGREEVLLPNKYVPKCAKIGDKILVFLYTDSNDRPIATTLMPKAQRGEIALLKVVDKNSFGCFLDLGIAKDIFMPTKHTQNYPLGKDVLVFIGTDRENRLVAKEHIKPYLCNFKESLGHLKAGCAIEIIPFRETPLGFECVINGVNLGMVYKNEIFAPLELFCKQNAFIKRIYPNGKCDITLKHPKQKNSIETESQRLLEVLRQNNGKLSLHFNSDPLVIKAQCALSKKAFKRAVNALLKDEKITLITNTAIVLRLE